MDLPELEGLALQLYAEANEDPAEPPGMSALTRAWLKTKVERAHIAATPSARSRVAGATRVYVRPSVPDEYFGFFIGHELGHELLDRSGYVGDDIEACADYLGAALLMPRAYTAATYRAEGFAPRALADAVKCTHTAAALRLAEVLGLALAAVSPALIRIRGPESFVWGTEEEIRRRAAARRQGPGIIKVPLRDQRGRVALLVDADEAGRDFG